ncbi:NAD-dependent malic enzyme [Neoactinobaculum massilliense]|uniref:NAD-dependent malic enzyme n=1 Tax=Neoactinobaculum massilliense TaxID=2364794 RepID=UPI000F53C998|nr:NAD-dependent malic enzyme [Neoactinobaculum massilliense]
MIRNGKAVLADPMQNKGTAFTREEREELGIDGLLPAAVHTIDQQEAMVYERFLTQPTPLAKRLYLMSVLDSNTRLYFYSMGKHLTEYMPIVYAPTVAQSIQGYNEHYFGSRVAYVNVREPENVERSLRQFAEDRDIRLVVVTDAEGILGIGDWGVNGAEILTGKLAVYTAAAGMNPDEILPVMLDAGTDRAELNEDPRYMGMRGGRVRGDAYFSFVDSFIKTVLDIWPKALLHWEDFGRPTAAPILEKYRDSVMTLNDDIQGTGVTVLGALEANRRLAGLEYKDVRVLIYGAGSAGIGIADQIVDGMVGFGGLTPEEARERVYAVDRDGLVVDGMPGLTEGQQRYARKPEEFEGVDRHDLAAVVDAVRPTALVGTSTDAGAFTETVVRTMCKHAAHPFIAPISNPTELAEAKAADVITWSKGTASVVTGTPSDPVEFRGVTYTIGQGNNALMYPGIALGAMVPVAKVVSRGMLLEGARALADMVDTSVPGAAVLPPVSELTAITRNVARAVVVQVLKEGINRVEVPDIDAALDAAVWDPRY